MTSRSFRLDFYSRIADGEVGLGARVGPHAAHDALDEHARREVLARALLALGGGLLQEAFVGGGLDVDAEAGPLGFIDHRYELFQAHRIVESALGARIDVPEDAGVLPSLRSTSM